MYYELYTCFIWQCFGSNTPTFKCFWKYLNKILEVQCYFQCVRPISLSPLSLYISIFNITYTILGPPQHTSTIPGVYRVGWGEMGCGALHPCPVSANDFVTVDGSRFLP